MTVTLYDAKLLFVLRTVKKLNKSLMAISIATFNLALWFHLSSQRVLIGPQYRYGSYIRVPLKLTTGTSVEATFVPQSSFGVIVLDFESALKSEPLRCFLIELKELARFGCEQVESTFLVAWSVSKGPLEVQWKKIEDETLKTYYTRSTSGLVLALLSLEADFEYKIVFQVLESPEQLQPIRCHLKVLLHPDNYKQVYASVGIQQAYALVLALIAVICLLAAIIGT